MDKIITDNVIKANAKAFIIPNHAGLVSTFITPDNILEGAIKFCELNGTVFNPDVDQIVQLWIHSDDLSTENLADHGGKYIAESGTEYSIGISSSGRHIPSNILCGHVEGDVITVKIPCWARCIDDVHGKNSFDIVIELSLTLQQRGYRYGSFGNFEEVLQKVMA